MKSVEELMAAVEADSVERLRWRVLGLLGVSPASLSARFFSGRRAMVCACHILLDREAGKTKNANPHFDGARFEEMRSGTWRKA